jgi:RND family efflux transporter MFP subunit
MATVGTCTMSKPHLAVFGFRRNWQRATGFFAASLFAMTVGCGQPAAPSSMPAPKVFVANPVVKDFVEKLEFTGNLRATETVQLRARVSGYLEKIHFKDGDDVKEDDLLFTIEQEPFKVALALAKAAHEKAEANLKLAKAEMDRTEPLVARGALSAQERDLKSADMALATADVNSALASIRQAELNLSYTEVRAPISGRIGRHLVDEGNLVESQMTNLTTIENFSPIFAYFGVSENDVQLIDKTAAEEDPKLAGKVMLGLSSEGKFPFSGKLDFTQLGVDQATGTQLRRAWFENADKKLKPGMFVRIQVALGKERQRVMVPERAVSVDQQGEYLLVVNDKNSVERRDVKLGASAYGLRVVEDGATAKDVLVVNGLQRARVGITVETEQVKDLPGVDKGFLAESHNAAEGTSEQPAAVTATAGE